MLTYSTHSLDTLPGSLAPPPATGNNSAMTASYLSGTSSTSGGDEELHNTNQVFTKSLNEFSSLRQLYI